MYTFIQSIYLLTNMTTLFFCAGIGLPVVPCPALIGSQNAAGQLDCTTRSPKRVA